MTEDKARAGGSWRRFLILAALAGAVTGVAAVYVMETGNGNAPQVSAACKADEGRLSAMRPLARGEVAGVIVPEEPVAVPALSFLDSEGQQKALADFAGRTVLVNLWATWCAPCREEMPELDELEAELGAENFEVVAVSIDTQNPQKARDFYTELGIENLAFYSDPKAQIFQDLKRVGRGVGLPTTLIIGPGGCEIGYLPGPAMWASDDAKGLIKAALGQS